MQNYSMIFPAYSIGTDIYQKISSVCRPYGQKIIAIGGYQAIQAARPQIDQAITHSDLEILDYVWYGGEASYEWQPWNPCRWCRQRT